MIEPAAIVEQARTWLDTPYVHQGRTKFGVDCIGYVICVRHAVEPLPDWLAETRNYSRVPKNGMLLERIAAHCTPIDEPEDGCVVLIKWPLTPQPSHVAIHAQGNILHAYQRAGKVIETGHRAHWARDTHSLWRMPGVAAP